MGILGVIELFLGFIALASPWIVGASFIWVIGIMLILGLMVIFGWPESTAWFVGTLIAVELIFSGWTLLLYAFSGNSARR